MTLLMDKLTSDVTPTLLVWYIMHHNIYVIKFCLENLHEIHLESVDD